jgi:alcohol dehydrogenase class IV
MGRYYNGDIDGKFWFAVQPSNAGERFGAKEISPYYIEYEIDREDSYNDIVKELESIESNDAIKRVDDMFKMLQLLKTDGYDDDTLKQYGVKEKDIEEYADYELGKQIKNWFDDNPDRDVLSFQAEL